VQSRLAASSSSGPGENPGKTSHLVKAPIELPMAVRQNLNVPLKVESACLPGARSGLIMDFSWVRGLSAGREGHLTCQSYAYLIRK
jgi:hypothetical protein